MGFNIEHADSLRKSHEYDHLFEYCKKYENDPDAMTELSTCYLYGYGTKANDNMCFYYDLKAAHLGSSTGKANLGYDYLHVFNQNQPIANAFHSVDNGIDSLACTLR